MKRSILPLSLVLILATAGTAALMASDDSALVGKPAPDFSLQRYGNGQLSLSGLRGKVVLVAFWIPSVPECKKAMPKLENLYGKYRGRGLEIVGVDMKGQEKAAANFRTKRNITYPLVKGDGRMALKQWAVKFAPSYFLIDRNGTVVHYYSPNDVDNMQRLEQDIVELLGK